MYQDAADLDAFYRSPLGQVARRLLIARIRALWPDLGGLRLMGLGYATPYLRVFRDEAERVLAVAPAAQGVIRWPGTGAARVCLANEDSLPLPDAAVDRVLLVHALEPSQSLAAMMREVWRVTTAGGRILAVAANRRGIWARVDHTPFGHGHPYSEEQIERLLRDNMFTPLATEFALYMPPSQRGLALWAPTAWERVGRRWGLPLPGVVIVEAAKQIYGAVPAAPSWRAGRRVLAPTAAARLPSGRRADRAWLSTTCRREDGARPRHVHDRRVAR